MNYLKRIGLLLLVGILGAALLAPLTALAQSPGTTFTYQGSLADDGTPVDDTCDLQFKLYDAATNGTQIGSTQPANNVTVSEGLFAVDLDFGDSAFTGLARWLEMSVQCSADSSASTLTRQPLNPTPYAIYSAGNWGLSGNSGTDAATDFIGTTDNVTVTMKVNNATFLRAIPGNNSSANPPNLIGGDASNAIAATSKSSVIAGGDTNTVDGNWSTISGGDINTIDGGSNDATIGGGSGNTITGTYGGTIGGGDGNTIDGGNTATIGGGNKNYIEGGNTATIGGGNRNYIEGGGDYDLTIGGGYGNSIFESTESTISGGGGNTIQAGSHQSTIGGGTGNRVGGTDGGGTEFGTKFVTIGGGRLNQVSGENGTIPGGRNNYVTGTNSLAAGYYAQAIHNGAFVWADGTADRGDDATWFKSGADNQFAVRATGGISLTGGAVSINNAYSLPTSDGTSGQVLQTDGSGAVTWADAGGSSPANIIWVAKSGGDYTSIQSAVSYAMSLADVTNPYLIMVAPGVYNERVSMSEYVDIQGSGEGKTIIKAPAGGSNPDDLAAIVTGADNAQLRFLTVENTGGNSYSLGVYSEGATSLLHVTVYASGGSTRSVAVYDRYSKMDINNATLAATGGTNQCYGLNTNAAIGSTTSTTVNNSIIASSGCGSFNAGIVPEGYSVVTVRNSEVTATTESISRSGSSNSTIKVATSLLQNNETGTVTCVGVYAENYAALDATCD